MAIVFDDKTEINRGSLVRDISEALRSEGVVDPDMAERLADKITSVPDHNEHSQQNEATIDGNNGGISQNAKVVLEKRYLRKDDQGNKCFVV